MPDQPSERTFISYSRKDGAEFAADLRARLLKEDLSVWQDLIALKGGRDWWSQIEDALKSKALQHFVLVVTPGALASPVVRREIRLARQEGKTVSPVRGPGLDRLSALPRWIGHVYDIAISEQFTNFVRVLRGPSTQKRVAMMAPEPPADFVDRPAEFGALKQQLLDAKGDAVAITAALRGAAGYGKTTLARKLAHDPDIQDAYFDGILWVELGEKPGNLLSIISDVVEILAGERPGLENINAAAAKLGEALGHRRILMIVDDAWREQDLRPFLHSGPNTTRLITTRRDNILPDDTVRQPVDAMRSNEALQLLAGGLPAEQVAALRSQFAALAGRLGEWAQLLKIVNGFLRDRVLKNRQPLVQAVAGVDRRLDEKGFQAFDARSEADRTRTIAYTIQISLDLLPADRQARFGELGVFPEDVDIPIGIVATLWAETGGLDAFAVEDLLSDLHDLSLLLGFDLDQRTLRLHDTVRHFLHDQAGKHGLVAQHKRLLQAFVAIGGASEAAALTRRYYYLHLLHHLAAAGERERLDALLLDPGWLQTKLAATGNPHALVDDFEQYGVGEAQSLIGRTLRLIAGVCARDPRQFIPQLLGRLMACASPHMAAFLDSARRLLVHPAILVNPGSLTPPGAEAARLEGHSGGVAALCVLPDGQLASGSHDTTIRLWDVTSGVETARLEGHSSRVAALCVLPDGRLASGSSDNTIRLWDVRQAAEIACLEGHSDAVTGLCVLPDGRLAWASEDRTIRLWDMTRGIETARLKSHSSGVTALCVLPDGRLASGSGNDTIWLWDVTRGVETARLKSHSDKGRVTALCVLPDGRLASGSGNDTIRLWDVTRGAESGALKGHSGRATALCVLPGGRLASGSEDKTIRLWDVMRGTQTPRPKGHSGRVTALCVLGDGRLASGSGNDTIRLWDVTRGAESARLEWHSGWVTALCVLPDGRLASGSDDNTIRLWDMTRGFATARLKGHSYRVTALCVLPDGRLASSSYDKTIRLWDTTSGAETVRLETRSRVTALWVLPDGRLASGSGDTTIRLWDVTSGAETVRLEGRARVTALCGLPDGRLASGYYSDGTIRLWNLTRGAETARLEGHSRRITALCVLPNGRLASGSEDKTIRLWEVKRRARGEVARLEVDAPVQCLVALPDGCLVAGDTLGRLHWLEIVD